MDGLRIFVLEDDKNMRDLLVETLEDEGYLVGSASSGREAVDKVTGCDFDLLIFDVRMEGMSGLDAFSLLKQQGIEVACLVITGYATEEDSIRAIRLGVGDYLRKPFEMREFLLCVRRLSAQHLRHRESSLRQSHLESLLEWTLKSWRGGGQAEIGRALASSSGLDRAQQLQIELALVLPAEQADGLRALDAVPAYLSTAVEALRHEQERWDGGGPRGMRGEEIPLAGRIMRLARLPASAPGEMLREHAGAIDPFLLEHVLGKGSGSDERRAAQLIGVAGALADWGDLDGMAETLRELEVLVAGAQANQVRLLRMRLLPQSERPAWARQTLMEARHLSPREQGRTRVELGLALLQGHPGMASDLLQEALAGGLDEGQAARARLALWTLAGGDPTSDLEVLMGPAHERHLAGALPWLWNSLIPWWSSLGGSTQASSLRFIRHYSSILQAQLHRLEPAHKLWLCGYLSGRPWGKFLLQQMLQDDHAEVRGRARLELQGAPGQAEAAGALLRLECFGAFAASVGGEPIAEKAWRGARNKYLLAYLAAAGQPVSEDRLVDLFWDEDAEKGKRGLYNSLSHLRKILRPSGWPGELEYLQRIRDRIALKGGEDRWFDVAEFEQALQSAARLRNQGHKTPWRAALRQACSLYQGPFLVNCYMDWAAQLRTRLDQEALGAFLQLADLEDDPELALEATQRALVIDDCSQPAIGSAMRCYATLGRPEEAIRLYEVSLRRLKVELEIEPSLELFEAYQRARMA